MPTPTPKEPDAGNTGLGQKKEKPVESKPDWRPYKPGIEINSKGQLRTVPRY